VRKDFSQTKRFFRTLPGLVLVLVGLSACAAQSGSKPIAVPQPEARAASLPSSLVQRDSLLTSLQTPAIMEYSGPAGHIKAREQVTARRPASLRIEAMSPLGVAMIVAADADHIAVFNPSNNTLMRGTATAITLARFTQIPMPPEQAVRLLLGLAPDNSILSVGPSAERFENGLRILSYAARGEASYEIGFSDDQLALVRQRDSSGNAAYEVHYSAYRDVGAMKFPFEIEAHFFASATTIKLRYLDPLIDRQIADSTFVLSPGPGTKLLELGFAGAPATAAQPG
jgi:hypothetical protein